MKNFKTKLAILPALILAATPIAAHAQTNHWNWPGYEDAVTLPAEVPGDTPWTNLPGEVPGDTPWTNLPGTVYPPLPPAPPIAIQPPRPIPPGPTVIRFVIGSSVYQVHGENRTDAEGLAPFIHTERTMVPLRLISEIFGAEVTWVDATDTIYIDLDGQRITMRVGVPLPQGMGMPVIRNERTFVPITYVSELLGATVRWEEATRAVYITR